MKNRSLLLGIYLLTIANTFAQTGSNVGIGTLNPQQKLHVAGGLRVDTLATGGTGGVVKTGANGSISALPFTSFDQRRFLNSTGSFDTISEVPANGMILSPFRNDPSLVAKKYSLYGAMQLQRQFSSGILPTASAAEWYPTYVEGNAAKLTPYITTQDAANVMVNGQLLVFAANLVYAYNPLTDIWTLKQTLAGTFNAMLHAKAVYTGSEVIVFGGGFSSAAATAPFRYNPSNGNAALLPTLNQPSSRKNFAMVWTGFEVVVWGGFGLNIPSGLADGAYYTPNTDSWTPVNPSGALSARGSFSATLIDPNHMLFFGGTNSPSSLLLGDYRTDGKIYDPYQNIWTSIATANAPTIRADHSGTLTSSGDIYVYGGYYGDNNVSSFLKARDDMYKYNVIGNSWTVVTGIGLPLGRYGHSALFYNNKIYYANGLAGDITGAINPNQPITVSSYGYEFNPATSAWASLGYTGSPITTHQNLYLVNSDMLLSYGGNVTGVTDDRQYLPGTRYLFNALNNFPVTYVNGASTVYLYQKK